MYKVIKFFRDNEDIGYVYKVGDEYPRNGYNPSEKRIKSLATANNRQRTALIEEIVTEEKEIETLAEETEVEEVPGKKTRGRKPKEK